MAVKEFAAIYKEELLGNVVPFWLRHSRDAEFGGFLTSLDRQGKVYDTDKHVWLQGRQVWTFAMLYDQVEPRQEWLDMAVCGAEFLKKFGHDDEGKCYFSLTREGRPLVQPYNIFSDCFATMGYGMLAKCLPDSGYAELAEKTYWSILSRTENPKGIYNKLYPGTRPMKNLALPMILCNLSLGLEHVIGTATLESMTEKLVDEILTVFYNEELGLVLENVQPDGSFCDSFEGRLINPGHSIEAMWFLIDLGVRLNRPEVVGRAVTILLRTLEYAWDQEFGGIFYFLDVKKKPLLQLEWDQKLWWVHVETLVALAKAYRYSDNPRCKQWFETVHEYTWSHFRDPAFGEWFGYLNRRGELLSPLKGGKWKGCFHLPRALFQVASALSDARG
jgi:N-acylglucosamine 2-epimerase